MAVENEYFDNGSYGGPWASSGRPVNHRYLGLKFVFGGRVHVPAGALQRVDARSQSH